MPLADATPEFAAALAAAVPGLALREDAAPYHLDPRGRVQGRGPVMAPGSTDQVAAVLAACNAARVGVIPFGGGTGLVGGQVSGAGPVPLILSLERMRQVRALHRAENVLIAEAGAILADVQAAARGAERLFALSLASEGSARIGGLLGTNAGGVNVLRYGNARAQCLGLEAVFADGRVWNGLTRLHKDNSGYDLRDLIIGAEGTLAVITAAALKLHPVPAETGTACLATPSPEAALALLALARDEVGEAISAYELIGGPGAGFLAETGLQVHLPFAPMPAWTILIELGLTRGQDPQAALERIFERAAEAGLVEDGVIATSQAQRAQFWQLRELLPEANKRIGAVASHDISLPLSEVPGFIAEAPAALEALAPGLRINCFGHLGDGNLHYNLFAPKGRRRAEFSDIAAAASRIVHDLVAGKGGSISAEHGIGRFKAADLQHYGDKTRLAAMAAIKQALDPVGILNPGAVFAADMTKDWAK